MHITCMQTALDVHKNLCTVLIPLCKNNLNLPMCSSFFSALCLVACSSHSSCCRATYLHCADFFVCFCRNWLCSPAINQISLSQSKGWFPYILLHRQEKYCWTDPLGLSINYTNRISELYLHTYLLKNYHNVINVG